MFGNQVSVISCVCHLGECSCYIWLCFYSYCTSLEYTGLDLTLQVLFRYILHGHVTPCYPQHWSCDLALRMYVVDWPFPEMR